MHIIGHSQAISISFIPCHFLLEAFGLTFFTVAAGACELIPCFTEGWSDCMANSAKLIL